MAAKKDITVVVPVYNGAEMLSACVDSILCAGERIAEIIIVDDGSTDDTLAIAEARAERTPWIRVIHTDNHGCYTARVTGLQAAQTPYVASADVDDRYVPGALDLLAELLESNDADVAIGAYREVTTFEDVTLEKNAEARVLSAEQMWPRIMKWKTQEFVNYVWNKLYKRELFSTMTEADGVNQGEDVLITCQAFCRVNRIVETAAPVYLYYQNPDSLTRVGFGRSDLDLIRVWDAIVLFMKENRQELVSKAEFNRWRTDFTLITRLILANNKEADKTYKSDLALWRKGLKEHWKMLIAPHAMPKSREMLVFNLRFLYWPTRFAMRLLGGKRKR